MDSPVSWSVHKQQLEPEFSLLLMGSLDSSDTYLDQQVPEINSLSALRYASALLRPSYEDTEKSWTTFFVQLFGEEQETNCTLLSTATFTTEKTRYSAVVRQKVGLPLGSPSSLLFHRRLYGLRHLGDALTEEQLSTAHLRLNDHDLLGKVLARRVMAHQAECRLQVSPLLVPTIGAQFTRHNFLGHVCRLMVDRDITFHPPGLLTDTSRLIGLLLPPGVYPKVAHRLFLDGVASLDDVLTEDGQSLASWQDLRQRYPQRGRGPVHRWYKELVKVVSPHTSAPIVAAVDVDTENDVETIAVASRPHIVVEDDISLPQSPPRVSDEEESSENEKLISLAPARRRVEPREEVSNSLTLVTSVDKVTTAVVTPSRPRPEQKHTRNSTHRTAWEWV
ncbi:MAG: hypothetical protein JOS17DRAFT_774442 [Linnemannia elongata]|nr:MAG: hypothetical protein JOS17DRAFT_774442 [Linnemannia elongata]